MKQNYVNHYTITIEYGAVSKAVVEHLCNDCPTISSWHVQFHYVGGYCLAYSGADPIGVDDVGTPHKFRLWLYDTHIILAYLVTCD